MEGKLGRGGVNGTNLKRIVKHPDLNFEKSNIRLEYESGR